MLLLLLRGSAGMRAVYSGRRRTLSALTDREREKQRKKKSVNKAENDNSNNSAIFTNKRVNGGVGGRDGAALVMK